MRKHSFLLSFAAMLLAGCTPSHDLNTQSVYTFTNQTGERVTFDMYPTKADFDAFTNRAQHYLIAPGAAEQLSLDVGKGVWIDWHTDSYRWNNWRSPYNATDRPTPASELIVSLENDAIGINAPRPDTARSVLMNGDELASTWISTFTNRSQLNGEHIFVFRKDFSGEYSYTDLNGIISRQPFTYAYTSSVTNGITPTAFQVTVTNVQHTANIASLTCNVGNTTIQHTGRDSLLVRFNGFSPSPDVYAVRRR